MSNRIGLAALLALALPAFASAYAQAPATSTPPVTARPPMSMPATPAAPAVRAPAAAAPAAVPAKPTAPAATTQAAMAPAAAGSKVDINSATEAQLDAGLTGVGPVRAKAIVSGRPYADLTDLVKKKVLTQGVFDKAKSGMALASINSSSAALLEKTLPGIGDVRSKAIVAGRPYTQPSDLVTKGVLTQGQFDKISGLIAL